MIPVMPTEILRFASDDRRVKTLTFSLKGLGIRQPATHPQTSISPREG